ncbi:MAG: glycosyltransferase family 39 protein [Deltaproteobacteria bacterium]|nr:glycosyltransferase family 39 protein [Deltaproteobacteria bacterium]
MPPRWLPLLLALVILVPGIGAIDLWAPDEPRYAQVAEEVRSLEHGPSGVLLLHLGGEVYTQKPPLYYWLAALLGAPGGHVSEWAARGPSVLAGLGCVLAVQSFGARLFSLPGVGAWAALVLISLLRFAHQARRAQLDVLLTLFECVALMAGWAILQAHDASPRRPWRWLLVLHGGVGLAMLTKGPVGALPYLVLLVFLVWEGRLREVRRLFPAWGIGLALSPSLAWLASAVALAPAAGFFADAVVDNVLARFFSGTAHVRPFYYYARQLPLDLLPWTPLVVLAAVSAWRRQRGSTESDEGDRSALRLLLAWGLTFVVFFSLSSGKRGLYMLPAFPAAALLSGWLLARALEDQRLPRGLESCGIAFVAIAGTGGALITFGFPLPTPTPPLHVFGSMLTLIAALYVPIALWQRRRCADPAVRGTGLIVSLAAVELAIFIGLFPALNAQKSPRALAQAVTQLTSNHERVGVFRHSALIGGIVYYSGRRAVPLESQGDLLRFVAGGDRIVVARAHRADEVARVVRGEVRAAVRHGRRQLMVIQAGIDESTRSTIEETVDPASGPPGVGTMETEATFPDFPDFPDSPSPP